MLDLHPVVVHFPIVLLTAVGVLAIVKLMKPLGGWEKVLDAALWVGTVLAMAAVTTGLTAHEPYENDPVLHEHIEAHQIPGFVLLIWAVLLSVWRLLRRKKMKRAEFLLFTVAALVMIGLVFYTGWEGGELVYDHGVGVKAK